MATRDIGRKAKTTRLSPFDVLIAGEDFGDGADDPDVWNQRCADFDYLRDAQSNEREAIDESYIESILAHGPQNAVRVVMRHIDGRGDSRYPVVLHGRRTVRHVREVWTRCEGGLEGYGQHPMIEIRVAPSSMSGMALFSLARIENHPGLPETPAQVIEYIAMCDASGKSDEDTCKLLQLRPTQLATMREIGENGMIPSVRGLLDSGQMPVSAAAILVRQNPAQQQAAIARINTAGGKFTVDAVRRALAGQGAIKATFRPPTKVIKAIMDDADRRQRLNQLSMQATDVISFMRGELDMSKFPALANLMSEVE